MPFEQSARFQQPMKASGNPCDSIAVPGGIHGMGAWDKLNSDYRQQMIAWLGKTLELANRATNADVAFRLLELDGTIEQTDGIVTKVFIQRLLEVR